MVLSTGANAPPLSMFKDVLQHGYTQLIHITAVYTIISLHSSECHRTVWEGGGGGGWGLRKGEGEMSGKKGGEKQGLKEERRAGGGRREKDNIEGGMRGGGGAAAGGKTRPQNPHQLGCRSSNL